MSRCERCDGLPDFRIERRGDAVVTWACIEDAGIILNTMFRVDRTDEIIVTETVDA